MVKLIPHTVNKFVFSFSLDLDYTYKVKINYCIVTKELAALCKILACKHD